jgi:transcriptional regulator with XRE-family HTH domain
MSSVDSLYREIGELVRAEREQAHVTQDELAARVGLTRTSITNIEKGRQKVQVHTLYAIAGILRISAYNLLPATEFPEVKALEVKLPKTLRPAEMAWVKNILAPRRTKSVAKEAGVKKLEPGTSPDTLLQENYVKEPPVPVERIARNVGVQVRSAPFKGEMSGLLFRDVGSVIIGINSLQPKERQRFAIAHEIGHLALHDNTAIRVEHNFSAVRSASRSGFTTDKTESSANDFAANLLMPLSNLKRDLIGEKVDYQDKEFVGELAGRYAVSLEVATYQLIMLEMKSIR